MKRGPGPEYRRGKISSLYFQGQGPASSPFTHWNIQSGTSPVEYSVGKLSCRVFSRGRPRLIRNRGGRFFRTVPNSQHAILHPSNRQQGEPHRGRGRGRGGFFLLFLCNVSNLGQEKKQPSGQWRWSPPRSRDLLLAGAPSIVNAYILTDRLSAAALPSGER